MTKLKLLIKAKLYILISLFILFSCSTRSLKFNMEKNNINSNKKIKNKIVDHIDNILNVFDGNFDNENNIQQKSMNNDKMSFEELKETFYYLEEDDTINLNKTPLSQLDSTPINAKFLVIDFKNLKCGKFNEGCPSKCSNYYSSHIKGYWSIIPKNDPKALLVHLC